MKFTTIIAAAQFGLAAYAAAVQSEISTRQLSTAAIISNDIATLTTTVNTDLGLITTAIAKVGGAVSGQLQLIAQINVDLAAIVNAAVLATAQLTDATTAAVAALNPVDLVSLVASIQATVDLITQIEVTLHNGLTSLPAATQAALRAEVAVLATAVANLAAPLEVYAAAVATALTATGVSVTGLNAVVQSLVSIVASFSGSIGIGS